MADTFYQPTARRPIAGVFRRGARGITNCCLRWQVHPDTISYLSIVMSAAAGICFWQSGRWRLLLLIAPGFCYVRLFLNMLDGMVALASGKASLRGEIVNELPDRVSDLMIFVGVAHSGLNHLLSGYWAAIFALLTAYVGTMRQAITSRREFGGWMSKPWRMVTLHAGAWITLALISFRGGYYQFGGLTVLDYTCLVVVAGCVQTICVRVLSMWRALSAVKGSSGGE